MATLQMKRTAQKRKVNTEQDTITRPWTINEELQSFEMTYALLQISVGGRKRSYHHQVSVLIYEAGCTMALKLGHL